VGIAAVVIVVGSAIGYAVVRDDKHATVAASSPTTTSSTGVASSSSHGVSYIATAVTDKVEVFDEPGASTPSHDFENPWFVNGDHNAPVPLVFLVEQQQADGWVQVLLPIRPNSSSGWIHASDVTIVPTPYRIEVEIGARRLRAYDGDDLLVDDTVAVGAPATPTPTGTYFIRALLKSPSPNSVYGPYAYGLSGYSETLQTFDGGDAEIGIHGNNDASVLGHDISHGCVRMSNDAITKLVALLPLGTPVEIRA